MYTSDRFPISLACGVPHITNYQPSYEHVYQDIPGLFVIKTPDEAVDVALYIMSLPIERRKSDWALPRLNTPTNIWSQPSYSLILLRSFRSRFKTITTL